MNQVLAEVPRSMLRDRGDRTAVEIIESARSSLAQRPARAPMRGAFGLSVVAALLLWLSFPPFNFSPLAWLAPVPLLILTRLRQPTRRMWLACYLGGLAFYLPTLQWLRLGDPLMHLAWWALAAYLAVTFPVQVALTRLAARQWSIPLVWATPIIWVGLDFAKAYLFTGFSWYYLGHTQYRWLELIQISDVVGAYGVTFVMVQTAAALTGLIPETWFARCRLLPPGVTTETPAVDDIYARPHRPWRGVIVAATVFSGVMLYGVVRRSQADFQPGPRVALIQGNYRASLRIPPEDYGQQFLTHLKLTALAVREQPDLIVWPEAMFRWPLASAPAGLKDEELRKLAPRVPPDFWRDPQVRETLIRESQKTGAAMIIGLEGVDLQSDGRIQQTNSALLVRPETGITTRYDKRHLVPFGEYVPWQKQLPWLASFTPYPPDFGLTPGEGPAMFEHGGYRILPVICFEDTVPQLVRGHVAAALQADGKPVDLLVNLSNDGWFQGSCGLDQHLITAAFRAVECRVPLVRAVNTGISAVIDGDGAIRDPERFIDGDQQQVVSYHDPATGTWRKQLNAALVSTVPLDPRDSLYVRWGDWFALGCLGLTVFCGLMGLARRRSAG